MAKTILIEEFHATVLMAAGLSKATYAPVIRTLNSKWFQPRVHEAIGNVIQRHPSLNRVKFSISR